MKKVIFILIFISTYCICNSQPNNHESNKTIYEVYAPDGDKFITIKDDKNSSDLILESRTKFYKYEVYDPKNYNLLLITKMSSKTGIINKADFKPGNYIIKVYDKEFVVSFNFPIKQSKFTS